MAIVDRIREKDVGFRYDEWSCSAHALAAMTHDAAISNGNARLRASNYMRTAEFFLAPGDPERPKSAPFVQAQLFAGLELLGIAHERLRLPYEGVEMEAILLPASGASDTLFVMHSGFDSTPEELFFTFGREAQARGHDVLIYEGPGQGNLLRKHGLRFDPDWDKATRTAIDAAVARRAYGRIIGIGISMGGHFLARAAAHERRRDGIVLCDYFPEPIQAFKNGLLKLSHRALVERRGWPMKLIASRARSDVELNWVVENGKWVFGAAYLPGLVERMLAFKEDGWVEDIEAHVLALTGSAEHFFDKRLVTGFMSRLGRSRSATHLEFGPETGGQLHCRNGAYHLLSDTISDWVAEKVPPSPAAGRGTRGGAAQPAAT